MGGEASLKVIEIQHSLRAETDVDDAAAFPPREFVGVVLEQRREDHGIVIVGHRSGELVDRFGRFSVKITVSSSGSAPTNLPTSSRASSKMAVL